MFTALFLLFINLGFSDSTSTDNAFLRGQELHNQGEYMQAMDAWLTEWRKFSLDETYEIDPRCAVAFIKTATEQEFTSAYKVASLFYFEALKSPKMMDFHADLEEEWQTTALLSSVYEKSFWESIHKELPQDFGKIATEYWRNLDPNPLTEQNEGLIRFFERRALAESMFPDSDYNDERKRTVVSLGKPNYVISGTYSPNWVTIIQTMSEFGLTGESGQLYLNYLRPILMEMKLSYEIWQYGDDDEIVFFSTGLEAFKESSVMNFIPLKLKRVPRLGSMNVEIQPFIPAFFVQFDVSQQLATKSSLYARQFTNVMAILGRGDKTKNLLAEIQTLDSEERNIQTFARLARPENTIAENPDFEVASSLSEFVFLRKNEGNFLVETHNWSQVNRKSETAQSGDLSRSMDLSNIEMNANLQSENQPDKQKKSMVDVGEKQFFATFTSEFPLDDSTPLAVMQSNALIPFQPEADSSATSSIFLGNSSKNLEISFPKRQPNTFAFSEAILGVVAPSDEQFSSLYSFQPTRENRIPHGKNLSFYVEVYPPEVRSAETQKVTLKISTKSVSGIAFLRRRGAKSVQLNLDVSEDWNPVELEYETKEFEPGKYTLVLELSGEGIKKSVVKEIGFVVE